MNVVDRGGTSRPECTNCNHRFDTDHANNPYKEMCKIAKGKYSYCPFCGAKYIGCQVEGIDFEKCSSATQDWINRGT
jgi:hypothetical protein